MEATTTGCDVFKCSWPACHWLSAKVLAIPPIKVCKTHATRKPLPFTDDNCLVSEVAR